MGNVIKMFDSLVMIDFGIKLINIKILVLFIFVTRHKNFFIFFSFYSSIFNLAVVETFSFFYLLFNIMISPLKINFPVASFVIYSPVYF